MNRARKTTAVALAAMAWLTFHPDAQAAVSASEAGVHGDVSTADPGLLKPGTLWVGTFDNPGSWKDNFGIEGFGNEKNATVEDFGIDGANGKVLRVTTPGSADQKSRNGLGFHAGLGSMGIGGQQEAYLRYRVYLPADFDYVDGGKLPGLAGTDAGTSVWDPGSGGSYTEGGWSGRLLFQKDHGVSTYLYVKRVGNTYIEDHTNPANGQLYGFSLRFLNPDGSNMKLEQGWNTIELHYKLNTPGANDGVFRGWINGQLGRTMTDVEYRAPARGNLDINQMFFSHYFGGSKGPLTTQSAYFDDIVISGGPIGEATPMTGRFSDTAGSAHAASIAAVADAGISTGYPDRTFRPGVAVTRGQMATLLAQALHLPPGAHGRFPDAAGDAHEAAIDAIASSGGITNGYGDGTFRPGDVVSREQMATFLVRALGLAPAPSGAFRDVSGVHAASVAALQAAGITGGYEDGTFRPDQPVTRGQMATFLARGFHLQ